MVKGRSHDKNSAAKGKATALVPKEKQQGWAAWYLESCRASRDKRLRLFQEKYGQFKEDSRIAVEGKEWLYVAKFAFLVGLEVLTQPKFPSRLDLFVSSAIS